MNGGFQWSPVDCWPCVNLLRQQRDTKASSPLKAAMLIYLARCMQKGSLVPLDSAARWKAEELPPREPRGTEGLFLSLDERRTPHQHG